MKKLNSMPIGIAIGLIGPFFGFVIYWLIMFSHNTFAAYVAKVSTPDVRPKVLALSLLFNLIPFLLLTYRDQQKGAKGVLTATFIYVPVVLILKFGFS